MQTEQPEANREPRIRRAPLLEAQKTQVAEIMTRVVIVAQPDMSVETAIGLMLENGLSRLPVVNEEEQLVGIVSKTDLVTEEFQRGDTSELQQPPPPGAGFPERGMHIHLPGAFVSEVMQPASVTVTEKTQLARAAELMAVHQLHGLPVVSSKGAVVGMISALDIAGWVAGIV